MWRKAAMLPARGRGARGAKMNGGRPGGSGRRGPNPLRRREIPWAPDPHVKRPDAAEAAPLDAASEFHSAERFATSKALEWMDLNSFRRIPGAGRAARAAAPAAAQARRPALRRAGPAPGRASAARARRGRRPSERDPRARRRPRPASARPAAVARGAKPFTWLHHPSPPARARGGGAGGRPQAARRGRRPQGWTKERGRGPTPGDFARREGPSPLPPGGACV